MGLYVKDNNEVLNKMFEELKSKNHQLHDLVVDVARFIEKTLKKDTTITEIYRTKEQQKKIYGQDTKKISPHMLYHAVDLRSHTFTESEIIQICKYINDKYGPYNHYKITAFCHEVNNHGKHFHIQFVTKV